jgi:hypothetical protein
MGNDHDAKWMELMDGWWIWDIDDIRVIVGSAEMAH